jgi:hypothetical protein
MALLSIHRGCAFAGLAVIMLMLGLSPYPDLAFRSGAVVTAVIALVLFFKARQAPTRNYRQTELWYMLQRNPGLPEAYAGRVINGILEQEYRRHAEYAGWIAAGLWAAGTLLAHS